MKMIKVKTAELEGKALDWVVAKSTGVDCLSIRHTVRNVRVCSAEDAFSPSTDWSQCGPLIDEYSIDFVNQGAGIIGAYAEFNYCPYEDPCGTGDTHLIAACRAIVAAEIGDEVEVPEVLL